MLFPARQRAPSPSGLGGRLVKGFAQQLGGQVERESDSQGTTVRLILPSREGSVSARESDA
jgi:two-component sensor histidine kinase